MGLRRVLPQLLRATGNVREAEKLLRQVDIHCRAPHVEHGDSGQPPSFNLTKRHCVVAHDYAAVDVSIEMVDLRQISARDMAWRR